MERLGNLLPVKKEQKNSKRALANPSPEEICPFCKGTGRLYPRDREGNIDYSKTIVCDCQKEDLVKRDTSLMLKFCELPVGTEKMTFGNFKVDAVTKEAFDAAVKVANDDGLKWLTLIGAVELGKTFLAVAICREWLRRGKAARYAYVPLLLEELREGFSQGGDMSYYSKLKFFLSVPLLVLDDLGVEKSTGFAREKLNTIIDYRFMNSLPLVVTMNVSLDEIPGDDEHRIASRLQRFPESEVIVLDGPEYRLRYKAR